MMTSSTGAWPTIKAAHVPHIGAGGRGDRYIMISSGAAIRPQATGYGFTNQRRKEGVSSRWHTTIAQELGPGVHGAGGQ